MSGALMCTALVISEDAAYRLQVDRAEAERRRLATERVCHIAAMALEESADATAVHILEPILGWWETCQVVHRYFPGYTRIRNFLIGELDADERIACRVAMSRVQLHNKHLSYLDRRFDARRGEVGWL